MRDGQNPVRDGQNSGLDGQTSAQDCQNGNIINIFAAYKKFVRQEKEKT